MANGMEFVQALTTTAAKQMIKNTANFTMRNIEKAKTILPSAKKEIQRERKKIDEILGGALAIIMGIMVINVLWQVFTRFVVGIPSSFTDELARYLMIWIGVLGAAYISGRKMHVAIDLLPTKLNKEGQLKLKTFINITIILFCFFALVGGGLRLVYITFSLEQYSPALQIPLSVVYLVIPISGILIIYYKISDILYKQL